MTYQDPDPMRDRDLDRNARIEREIDRDYGSNAMWGWIAGAVVLVLMLVFLFGGSNETNTASNQATAPVVNTPPANNMANAPRRNTAPPASSSETTGQSSSPAPSPQQ